MVGHAGIATQSTAVLVKVSSTSEGIDNGSMMVLDLSPQTLGAIQDDRYRLFHRVVDCIDFVSSQFFDDYYSALSCGVV